MTKRRLALIVLAAAALLAVASVLVLRTRWAGDRICALAAERVHRAAGLPVAVAACRIEPLDLALEVEGLVVGPPEAPVFSADAARARLAPVQGLGRRFELAELRLTRPRLRLDLPEGGGGACPPEALQAVEVRALSIADGAAELGLPGGGRVEVAGLSVDARRLPARPWRLGSGASRVRVAAAATSVRAARGGQTWLVERPAVEGAVSLDLSSLELARAEATVGGAALGLAGSVKTLCAPVFDLTATASGTLPALVALAGVSADPWQGGLEVRARLTGTRQAPQLGGTVRFQDLRTGEGGIAPGSGQAEWRWLGDKIAVDRLELPFATGKLTGVGEVRLRKDVPIDVQVKVEDVDLGEILERVAVPGAWVTVKLDGGGRVAGTILPAAIDAKLDLQAHRFRSLAGPWRAAKPTDQAMLEFERGRLSVPFKIRDDGIRFERVHLEVGAGRADVDARVAFDDAKGFEVVATGEVDLDALHHVAGLPWGGRAQVVARAAAAPYGNPRIDAKVKAERLRFLKLDLGTASFDAAYGPDHTLRLSGIEGTRGLTRYGGFATVDLGATPVRIPASRFTAAGPLRDLCDVVIDWLPSTRVLRDAMEGQVLELTALASGPAAALDADFEGRLGAGRLLGRRFDSGRLAGRISAGAAATFRTAELRFGPGTASATGRWGFLGPMPWDLQVALAGVPATALELPGGTWGGSLSGTASLAGSFDVPDVRFGVNGDAISIRGASLGTIQLGGTVLGRRLQVTGAADGARLTGEARLEGRVPFKGRAELDLKDAARLWPGGPPQGLKAAVEGLATAEGDLVEPLAARGRVELDRLSAAYADLKLENAGQVALSFDRGRVQVERFAVRGVNTEFSVAGSVDPSGALDLQAQGSLDLRLLGGVLPALRSPHGRLALQAHVGGSVEAPVLLGDGQVEGAGFQLRGGKADFTDLAGPLSFSQNKVLFDALTAQVNRGGLVLSGEVELDRLVPSRLRMEAQIEDVQVALPGYLPSVLSGRLEATGTPDETVVTGRLHVVRSRYTLNVDLDKRLVGLGRRAAPVRPYDLAGEWLRFDLQLVADGDVRVENDVVSGAMQGELTLTGSLASPGLVGSLSMLPGGRARFRGNEFEVTHAVVDFKDRNDIAGTIDAHGETRVSEYLVLVHLYGSLTDSEAFRADLTSSPPLSQPDILTLLSVGYARQDTPGGSGLQGLSSSAANQAFLATAAQALFQVSGFDEAMKRFLPRGGPLTDFTVRSTTLYSTSTGLLEPGLALEAWAVPNRLRLRAQVPFTVGEYRVQGELRLTEHASAQLQYDAANKYVDKAIIGPWTLSGDLGADLKLRWEWTR